jgi:hypothetical protein
VSAAETLARALGGRRNGRGWVAWCPAHDDHTPSLSIDPADDGKPLVICRAGCEQSRVIAALKARGLWQRVGSNGDAHMKTLRIVETYDYVDEAGLLLYQVVRLAPKSFRQRRPDGVGGWIWSLGDVRRVLYGLPDITEAVAHDHPIFIVEGEQDVESLRRLNCYATTNAGGAGKWRDDYADHLRGADVVVVPDNDDVGRQHMFQIATSLAGIAAHVRRLDLPGLPPKGDVSDWMAAGGTAEELWQLVEVAPDWDSCHVADNKAQKALQAELRGPAWKRDIFTAEALQKERFEPLEWLVQDVFPAVGVTLLCSRPKFGKSWLTYDLCIGCTADRYVLGNIKPTQGDVLYLALEDSKRRLQRRMNKLLPTSVGSWPNRLLLKTKWRRLHEGGLDDIRAWHKDVKDRGGNPIAVSIDVLAKVRKPTGNRGVYEADYEALAGLAQLASELNLAIIVVHHTRKLGADDLMETVSGSYGLSGAADTILVMANKSAGAVLDIRGRDVESNELAIQFSRETCRWTIRGQATDVHRSDQRARVLAALGGADEGLAVTEIVVAAKLANRNAADNLLFNMASSGDVERVKRGVYGLPGTKAKLDAKVEVAQGQRRGFHGSRHTKIAKKPRRKTKPLKLQSDSCGLSNLSNLSGPNTPKELSAPIAGEVPSHRSQPFPDLP